MIPTIIPLALGLTYLVTDLVLLILFLRERRQVSTVDINLVLLLKFKDLLDFYSKGESSLFVRQLMDKAQSSIEAVSVSQFTESYTGITEEIEKLYERFRLPYVMKGLGRDLRSAELQCAALSLLNLALIYGSFMFSYLLDGLLAVLLLNTIFWYPLMSTFVYARSNIRDAMNVLNEKSRSHVTA
jgi:hypothetical protein